MTDHRDLWYANPAARAWRTEPLRDDVAAFHRAMPGYRPTPLVELSALAASVGAGRVFVKDESSRFGLPAFKILGASYAIARALAARYGLGDRAVPLAELGRRTADDPGLSFSAATDGNHGRAVAHMAALLGVPATVYVPSMLTAVAKRAIADEGATVVELDLGYDDVVTVCAERARRAGPDHLVVQDTAWDGYDLVPAWIVDGYATLFTEADAQLRAAGAAGVDLVVVPVGVGSLAQAAVRHHRGGPVAPALLLVEPDNAPGVTASLRAGRPLAVPTGATVMTGLNCGTPSPLAWPLLAAGVDAAVTVGDAAAARAVADLEALGVDAGPCGAATLAGARAALGDPGRRAALDLPDAPVMLLVSTEGRRANPLPG